jgi:hypothetical protein
MSRNNIHYLIFKNDKLIISLIIKFVKILDQLIPNSVQFNSFL